MVKLFRTQMCNSKSIKIYKKKEKVVKLSVVRMYHKYTHLNSDIEALLQ